MANVLEHQGYTARIEFDAEDGVFVSHVLLLVDRISFHGESVAELAEALTCDPESLVKTSRARAAGE